MSFRDSIFTKLLASALLLIAVTLVVLNFYITPYISAREVGGVEKRLQAEAQILAPDLAGVPRAQLVGAAVPPRRTAPGGARRAAGARRSARLRSEEHTS